jgi:hypothetical protein
MEEKKIKLGQIIKKPPTNKSCHALGTYLETIKQRTETRLKQKFGEQLNICLSNLEDKIKLEMSSVDFEPAQLRSYLDSVLDNPNVIRSCQEQIESICKEFIVGLEGLILGFWDNVSRVLKDSYKKMDDSEDLAQSSMISQKESTNTEFSQEEDNLLARFFLQTRVFESHFKYENIWVDFVPESLEYSRIHPSFTIPTCEPILISDFDQKNIDDFRSKNPDFAGLDFVSLIQKTPQPKLKVKYLNMNEQNLDECSLPIPLKTGIVAITRSVDSKSEQAITYFRIEDEQIIKQYRLADLLNDEIPLSLQTLISSDLSPYLVLISARPKKNPNAFHISYFYDAESINAFGQPSLTKYRQSIFDLQMTSSSLRIQVKVSQTKKELLIIFPQSKSIILLPCSSPNGLTYIEYESPGEVGENKPYLKLDSKPTKQTAALTSVYPKVVMKGLEPYSMSNLAGSPSSHGKGETTAPHAAPSSASAVGCVNSR